MDFSAVCRTCLGTDDLNPIFAKSMDHGQQATAIFIATGIKMQLNDGLPQQMCTDCISQLNKSLSFRKQCNETAIKLLQLSQSHYLQNELTLKEIVYENSEILVEEKTDDILKIELKCEYQPDDQNTDTIKLENDLGSEISLNSLTDSNKENEAKSETNNLDEGKSSTSAKINVKTGNKKLQSKKNKVQRVSCPVCQKDLSPRSLTAHLRVKHGGLRCGYCNTECSSQETLATHTSTCPRKRKRRVCEAGKELVTCEVCLKVMQRASLRLHQAVKHKGLGPVCEHCGGRFGNKLRLSEHLRAKHGHEKLQCSRCEFKSSSRTALENHERRHRGEKPYVCETCGAKFHAAYLLAQHRQSHRTDKRVKCSLCGGMFKSSSALHAHRLARHGARRHACAVCARAFACRHYAVKHMRAVHGYKGTVPPLRVEPAPS